jgi:hypothetical protein
LIRDDTRFASVEAAFIFLSVTNCLDDPQAGVARHRLDFDPITSGSQGDRYPVSGALQKCFVILDGNPANPRPDLGIGTLDDADFRTLNVTNSGPREAADCAPDEA